MAVYDLEEQEQIDTLKAWWNQHGKLVIAAALAVVVAIGGFKAWQSYRHSQALQAAEIYGALQKALQANDIAKVREAAGNLVENYSGSGYATMAALLAARANFAAGDAKNAIGQLQWVVEHAKEEEMRDVARLRWAGILLDEKNYDEALRLAEAQHGAAFDARYADLKGDVLAAQGKVAEARSAYRVALDKSDAKSAYRGVIQMKLDALGDAK